jgi:transcriptional regulator with XRE-family HTH domain
MDEQEVAVRLGANIRSERSRKKLSRESLAARAGVHSNWLGTVERGEQNASVVTLLKISAALEVSPSRLLERVSVKKPPPLAKQSEADAIRQDRQDVDLIIERGDPELRQLLRTFVRALAPVAVKRGARGPDDKPARKPRR